jgi:hypothetical protein
VEEIARFGLDILLPELVHEGPRFEHSMLARRITSVAPTLVLLETSCGFECGGFAAVPWPAAHGVRDPSRSCFLFTLGEASRQFDLRADAKEAIFLGADGFGFAGDLMVWDRGTCWSGRSDAYAGRGDRGLVGAHEREILLERLEIWRL